MNEGLFVIAGLSTIMALVLLLPFLSRRIEGNLEAFLFVMGTISVTISHLWSWRLLEEAFLSPLKITAAVLVAGLLFRAVRPKIGLWTSFVTAKLGYRVFFFIVVVVLGLLSSVITAIIAALILAEIVTVLQLPRNTEIKLTIIACFAIGLGAALTPLGEPLSTIAVVKLKGEPYHADFFFLFKLLAKWIIPAIVALGVYAAFTKDLSTRGPSLAEDKLETNWSVVFRSLKVYLFVFALVLLGAGFTPVVERYLVHVSPGALFWINSVSAILDNATLVAAEITPVMSVQAIKFALLGLLISGGMLIPGNIPNIICASKLSIRMKEWAWLGVPLGLVLMLLFFAILMLAEMAGKTT